MYRRFEGIHLTRRSECPFRQTPGRKIPELLKDIVQAQNLLKLLSDWVLQNVPAQCQPFPELFPQSMAALQMRKTNT